MEQAAAPAPTSRQVSTITLYRANGISVQAHQFLHLGSCKETYMTDNWRIICCSDEDAGPFWFKDNQERLTLEKPIIVAASEDPPQGNGRSLQEFKDQSKPDIPLIVEGLTKEEQEVHEKVVDSLNDRHKDFKSEHRALLAQFVTLAATLIGLPVIALKVVKSGAIEYSWLLAPSWILLFGTIVLSIRIRYSSLYRSAQYQAELEAALANALAAKNFTERLANIPYISPGGEVVKQDPTTAEIGTNLTHAIRGSKNVFREDRWLIACLILGGIFAILLIMLNLLT